MIREIFLYLTTKTNKEAKTFGHLYEAISLGEREKRCQKFWKSHRDNSKRLILEVALKVPQKNSLLILGSGPLHEIPIVELSSLFKKISLIDVVHLDSTKKKFAHLTNLEFIEHDITEIETILARDKKAFNAIPQAFLKDQNDLVISANILSQLAYHLRNYLEKNAKPKLTEADLNLFATQVSQDHFLYLKKFPCQVLLITDIETYFKDKNGKSIERQTPYIDLTLPPPVMTWNWDLAPIPEYNPEISLQMKVAGFILNQ